MAENERDERADRREILLIPLMVWAGLMGLLALTFAYAYWPGAPGKIVSGMAVAAAKAGLIAAIFMQLRKASGIVLLASLAGLAWLSLLFIFSFADFLTR